MEKYNPDIHHRRSIRLRGYDYSQAGLYFVTICCQNKAHLFGEIDNGVMALNDAGRMIEKIWNDLPNDFPNIHLNEYTTMPNHNHGIINNTSGMDVIGTVIDDLKTGDHVGAPLRGRPEIYDTH